VPESTCDLVIMGGGPAGFTAALYAARAGLDTLVVSPGELTGMMARAAVVENFPAQVDPLPGRELLGLLRAQALRAGARHEQQEASLVDLSNPEAFLVAAGRELYTTRALIVATGALGRAEKLPGEEKYEGRGVGLCVACDGPLYKGQDVLVVGEDEQAAEEALALTGIARQVTLVAPTARLAVPEDLQQALAARANLKLETGLRLQEIVGDEQCATGARFQARGGEERLLEAPGIFLYLRGSAPATEFLGNAVEKDEQGYLITDELMQTSVTGVYAAGDVRQKQVRQMVVACAEGCLAALAAERYLRRRPTMRWDRGEIDKR
jgi:thioredoxin reductase (NADPH)